MLPGHPQGNRLGIQRGHIAEPIERIPKVSVAAGRDGPRYVHLARHAPSVSKGLGIVDKGPYGAYRSEPKGISEGDIGMQHEVPEDQSVGAS
jgi:hypothetical protein